MKYFIEKVVIRNFKKVPYFFAKRNTQLLENQYSLIGKLSTSLLHDILSPLTSLQIAHELGSTSNKSVSQIISHSNTQIKEYVEIMRDFLYQNQESETIHVNQEMHKCLTLIKHKALQNNIQIQFLEFDQIKSKIYPIHIYQIIINLLTNAIEASTETNIKKVILIIRKKGKSFCIECKDFGIGINEKDLYKIGLLKFSTKSEDRGVGLYSLHHLISEVLNGSLSIESEKGVGSLFTCTLPIIK